MAHCRQCGLVKGPKLRACKEGLLLILSVYLWDCIYNLIWKWLRRSKLEGLYECKPEWPCWHPWRGSTENSSAGGAGFAPVTGVPCLFLWLPPFCRSSCPGTAAAQSAASPWISTRTQMDHLCHSKGPRNGHLASPGGLQPSLWYIGCL